MRHAEVPPRMASDRPTIVVVDDEPEVLRSLHDLFRLEYGVLTFERASDALEALANLDDVAVILSDQRMPGISGVEFLEKAEHTHPDATRLLVTGYADIKAVIDAINKGHIARYISKPWNTDELAAVVRKAVEQHALIAEKNRLLVELKESNARLVEANRLKGKFIEVASHELNTPVTVVLGLAELWKMTMGASVSHAERAWVERIHGAGKRLASTVERMLKLLKSDQATPSVVLEMVELEPLLRNAIFELQPFLMARNQEILAKVAPDLGSAEVDPSKVADVLTNLIVNAIKFTPDGGIIVVEAGGEGPDRVRFRVIDQGQGISIDDRAHLFEPFFTGNDTMHHSSGEYQFGKRGMGLGLCLVKAFVELHGGNVDVETTPGRGSCFSFTLPRSPANGKAAKPNSWGRREELKR
jgi:signal transduction histidine kinase